MSPVKGRHCISEGPLVLQDHSRVAGRTIEVEEGPINGPAPETDMQFRNIRMRRLADYRAKRGFRSEDRSRLWQGDVQAELHASSRQPQDRETRG